MIELVVVTRNYQITILTKVRRELRITEGDNVVFLKGSDGEYRLVKAEAFVTEFTNNCRDIEETVSEVRERREFG